jgi:hypothetical protein
MKDHSEEIIEIEITAIDAAKYAGKAIVTILFLIGVGVALASCALPIAGAAMGLGTAAIAASERNDLESKIIEIEKRVNVLEAK